MVAVAARAAEHLAVSTTRELVVAFALVVAAGLVEGACIGLTQGLLLRRLVPGLRVANFVGMTVFAAGLGWAVGSLPTLRADGGTADSGPPLALLAVAGLGFGAVMGGLLGSCQRIVLRKLTRHSGRWVVGSVVAWAVAMTVIMLGASTTAADWPLLQVLAWAALTGTLAGCAVGIVLGWLAPSLDGVAPVNRVVLGLLRHGVSTHLARAVVGLRLRGRRTGRDIELPVLFAPCREDLVIAVADAQHKLWWRNLDPDGPVDLVGALGAVSPARAHVLRPSDDGYDKAMQAYRVRWPRAHLSADTTMMVHVVPNS